MSGTGFVVLSLAAAVTLIGALPPSRIVRTKYGDLRGVTVRPQGRVRPLHPVEAFLGVPYASPPVGYLRFMPPVTPPHWRGVRSADKLSPVCPQRLPDLNDGNWTRGMPAGRLDHLRRLLPMLAHQDEDCLYLNVYAPAHRSDDARLPVMVFVHGESYEWNAGNPYDGTLLSSHSHVIVVTLNYRLGVLGFLPVNDGSARGNYGLMDQVAALHWVQENVARFGGDETNVTVVGHGHGAACANLLLVSPMARGLFQRAVLMSGSALSPWAIARDAPEHTRHMAEILRCPSDDGFLLVECLRRTAIEDIQRVGLRASDHEGTWFGPTVDGIVVPAEPAELMARPDSDFANYQVMFGLSRVRALYGFSAEEQERGISGETRDRLMRALVRKLFDHHQFEIFATVVNEYTDWTDTNEDPFKILDATRDAISDALVAAPLVRAADTHARAVSNGGRSAYFYVFHESSVPLVWCCSDELPYVLGAPLGEAPLFSGSNFSRAEVSLSEAVMAYWTNFARNGDPNGHFLTPWTPYTVQGRNYLSIGSTRVQTLGHYHAHRLSFWLNLIPKLHQSGLRGEGAAHHVLPDHENPLTYDGIVRHIPHLQVTANGQGGDPHRRPELAVPSSEAPFPIRSTPSDRRRFSPAWSSAAPTSPVRNDTETAVEVVFHRSMTYSTVLGVTIAIGCSLLVLNILIFAGIYYQHDARMQRKQKLVDMSLQHLRMVSPVGEKFSRKGSFHRCSASARGDAPSACRGGDHDLDHPPPPYQVATSSALMMQQHEVHPLLSTGHHPHV